MQINNKVKVTDIVAVQHYERKAENRMDCHNCNDYTAKRIHTNNFVVHARFTYLNIGVLRAIIRAFSLVHIGVILTYKFGSRVIKQPGIHIRVL